MNPGAIHPDINIEQFSRDKISRKHHLTTLLPDMMPVSVPFHPSIYTPLIPPENHSRTNFSIARIIQPEVDSPEKSEIPDLSLSSYTFSVYIPQVFFT